MTSVRKIAERIKTAAMRTHYICSVTPCYSASLLQLLPCLRNNVPLKTTFLYALSETIPGKHKPVEVV